MPQANYCGHGRTAFENERISRTASFPPFLNTSDEFEQTAEAGGSGDGGDKYTGLDRFGRLVQTLWKKGNADQVRTHYGRNRFGGVVWRWDDRAHAQTPTAVTTEDNHYLYDGTNQIKERKRGNLLAGTPPKLHGDRPRTDPFSLRLPPKRSFASPIRSQSASLTLGTRVENSRSDPGTPAAAPYAAPAASRHASGTMRRSSVLQLRVPLLSK